MKSLLILVLAFGLCAALFLTRPTQADFEKFVHDNPPTVLGGAPTGGKTIAQTIGDKMKTFTADQVNKSAADLYLDQCTYENRYLWINVKKGGQTVYTGAVNHWFKSSSAS